MARRQVDGVETEIREPGQHLLDAGESAPRAREELVPRTETRNLAVDVDAELHVELDRSVPVAALDSERFLECDLRAQEHAALRKLSGEIRLPALGFSRHLALPGGDPVRPRG